MMDKLLYCMASAMVALLLGACGTNVVAAGKLGETVDPHGSDERWFTLSDLESGGLVLHGLGFERHEGALFDMYATHDALQWQACSEILLDAGDGELIEAKVVRNEVEPERTAFNMLVYVERVSFIVYDPELERLARASRVDLDACGHRATLKGAVQSSLARFVSTVLAAHEGQEWLPPLVVPSD